MKRSFCFKQIVSILQTVVLLCGISGVSGGSVVGAEQESDWENLSNILKEYKAQWTEPKYDGAITDKIPQTALLGNGDIGATSYGNAAEKTFIISKNDFWGFEKAPSPIGGITINETNPNTLNSQLISLTTQKTVAASSSDGNFPASRAVSGSWGQGYEGWVSAVTSSYTGWLVVDLGKAEMFNRFVVKHDAAARPNNPNFTTRDFRLQISSYTDNRSLTGIDNWSDACVITGNSDPITDVLLETSVTSRYVRLYINHCVQDTDSNPRCRIGQFDLFNTIDFANEKKIVPAENLPALASDPTNGAVATAINHHNDFPPERALSGFETSSGSYEGWVSQIAGSNPTPWWFMVNLGQAKNINRFVLKHDRASRPSQSNGIMKAFSIDYYTGSGTPTGGETDGWTTLKSYTDNTLDSHDETVEEFEAQYVRVYITSGTPDSTPANSRAKIALFQLWSPPAIKELNEQFYDLGQVMDIRRFFISLKPSSSNNISITPSFPLFIESSTDNEAWNPVYSGTSTKRFFNHEPSDSVSARYIKITSPSGNMENFNYFIAAGVSSTDTAYISNHPFKETFDIMNVEVLTEMAFGETEVEMQTWVSANENLIITKLTSLNGNDIGLSARLSAKLPFFSGENRYIASAANDTNSISVTRRVTAPNSNAYATEAVLNTKIIGADSVTTSSNTQDASGSIDFILPQQGIVYVVTAVGGGGRTYNFNGELYPFDDSDSIDRAGITPVNEAANVLAQVTDTDSVINNLIGHREWWKNYYLQSYILLDDSDSDLRDIMQYYYTGQYFLGAGVREGEIAPGLYGVWHTTDTASWRSDYHMNYNFISTFYGVNSSNRPEQGKPAIEGILNYMPTAEAAAGSTEMLRKIVNEIDSPPSQQLNLLIDKKISEGTIDSVNGIANALLYPVGIGPWGVTYDKSYHGQFLDALFNAYPIIQYYEYTLDESYGDKLYEFLKKGIELYAVWLVKEPNDDKYTLYGAYNEGSWSINPAVDLAVLKYALKNAIVISEKKDVDHDYRAKWQDILDNLPEQPVSRYKDTWDVLALSEKVWQNNQWVDMLTPVPSDANVLPLESVVPGSVIGYYSEEKWLKHAQDTIDAFENRGWNQMNSFPKIYPIATNIRYNPKTIITQFADTIRKRRISNLLIYDTIHGIEKSGATAAVNNMMILSHEGIIKLFPSWLPDKDAEFSKLRTKGAFIVSGSYDGTQQKTGPVTLYSEKGQRASIASPWAGKNINVVDSHGTSIETTKAPAPNYHDDMIYTFDTQAGETYTITEGTTGIEGIESVELDSLNEKIVNIKLSENENSKDASLIVALYSDDNKNMLQEVKVMFIEENLTDVKSFSFENTPKLRNIKVYLWKNLNEMYPVY